MHLFKGGVQKVFEDNNHVLLTVNEIPSLSSVLYSTIMLFNHSIREKKIQFVLFVN